MEEPQMRTGLPTKNPPAFALLGGLVALGCWTSCAQAAAPDAERPRANFIQILTDDQGWGDLGSFGHQFIESPHIDQLAKEGIKFTACYSAAAVCSPSRASILTGRTPYRNGVYRWIPQGHFCHLPKSEITLPQLLRKAGYQTAHFGKWHLSHYSEERIGKSEEFRNFAFGGNVDQPSMADYGYDYWLATGNVARPSHKNPLNFFRNGEALGQVEGFSAQIVASEFTKWIKEERKRDAPFFATVWFHEPHGPIETDPEFMKPYRDLADPSLRQYLGNVTQIDEAVGTIMKALQEAGVSDDTLVWFTSDNGPEGRHEFGKFNREDHVYGGSRYRGSTGGLRGRKRSTHEGGVRVPGIIRWPAGLKKAGLRPGFVSDEPIIGSDVFPTLMDIAGLAQPESVVLDGQSILPLLMGGEFQRAKPLYWRNLHFDARIALRDGDWKIVGDSARTEFALYDLQADPRETTDLSAHHPERFRGMREALIAYDKEVLLEGPSWWKQDERLGNVVLEEE
jgi:arylsulfatase A